MIMEESWKPGERDAEGRCAAFLASAFPDDAPSRIASLARREKS